MNTVTWGPEPSPRTPHSTHMSDSSRVDHHVERGPMIVTRSARRCDWEALSGRRKLAPKDELPPIPEDPLLSKRSVSARNSRSVSRTLGSNVESLRPRPEERVERDKGQIQPNGSDSVHSNPPRNTVLTVFPAMTRLVS